MIRKKLLATDDTEKHGQKMPPLLMRPKNLAVASATSVSIRVIRGLKMYFYTSVTFILDTYT